MPTTIDAFKREFANHSDLLSDLAFRVTLFSTLDHDRAAVTAIIETSAELLASYNRLTAILRAEGN